MTAAARPATSRARRSVRRAARAIEVSSGTVSQLGYKARRVARKEGRSYTTASGDWHLRYELAGNRDESRSYYQDNCLYRGIVDRAVDNIVRHGFSLQIRTADPKFNAKAEALRKEAWKAPEIRGNLSGIQIERIVCRDLLVAGDIGRAFIEEGRERAQFQLIESERITDGRGGTGVRMDRLGRAQAYMVADYTPTGQISSARIRPYLPEIFGLIANPERISQTRGTPALVSAFPYVNRVEDCCASEALTMQILARLAFTVEHPEAGAQGYGTSRSDPTAQSTAEQLDWAQRIHDLGSALVFHGPPGMKVAGIPRNIPSQMFVPAVEMFLRLMGLPLGLPLELVLLDWSKSNYSAARAALEQAFTAFLVWQQVLHDLFYEPVLNWQLDQWMADGKLPEYPGGGAAVLRSWTRPPFLWLDHLKEAQSWGVKIDRGLALHGDACKSVGQDRPEFLERRKKEIEEAIAIAKKIEAANPGVEVDWRLFAGLLPAGTNAPVENPAQEAKEPRSPADGSEAPPGPAGSDPRRPNESGTEEEE